MRPRKKLIGRASLISGVLTCGFLFSCAAMQIAFSYGDRKRMILFALCSGIMCVFCTLSLSLQVMRYVEGKKLEKGHLHVHILDNAKDYCATYSLTSRIVWSLLTVVAVTIAPIIYVHSRHPTVKVLISSLLVFCIVTLYRYLFTEVWFTNRFIVAELWLFMNHSELPAVLGNFAKIASILKTHTKISPDLGTTD
jgi:FtsH-binding integral membrane protein